jgi:hypothetical protein
MSAFAASFGGQEMILRKTAFFGGNAATSLAGDLLA